MRATDATLEREVRSLLAARQQAGNFLESPAIEAAARAPGRQHSGDDAENTQFFGRSDPISLPHP